MRIKDVSCYMRTRRERNHQYNSYIAYSFRKVKTDEELVTATLLGKTNGVHEIHEVLVDIQLMSGKEPFISIDCLRNCLVNIKEQMLADTKDRRETVIIDRGVGDAWVSAYTVSKLLESIYSMVPEFNIDVIIPDILSELRPHIRTRRSI